MFGIVIIALGLAVATIHLFVCRTPRTAGRVFDVYLLYTLVAMVGMMGLIAASRHLFMADTVAEQLGWPAGSRFQLEVGLSDLAFGVLGIGCIWFRPQWWYAAALGWSVFVVAAGVSHIDELMREGNTASLNIVSGFGDLLVPLLLLVLFVVRHVVVRRVERSLNRSA